MGTHEHVEKLSHRLIDLGFFCALGTRECIWGIRDDQGFWRYVENYVRRGEPNKFDSNNGVTVVYDEVGRPWILNSRGLTDEIKSMICYEYDLKHGAFVPHSNDGGFFVLSIMPKL